MSKDILMQQKKSRNILSNQQMKFVMDDKMVDIVEIHEFQQDNMVDWPQSYSNNKHGGCIWKWNKVE